MRRNVDAISHLNKGLEVVAGLPDTVERAHRELALQAALGPVLIAVKSWAAPETGAVWLRARELYQQVGDTPLALPVLYGAMSFYGVQPQHETGLELAVELLDLAQVQVDDGAEIEGYWTVAYSEFYLADLPAARMHAQRCIELYGSQLRPELALHLFDESGAMRGNILWSCNDVCQRGRKSLAMAVKPGDTITILNSVSGG